MTPFATEISNSIVRFLNHKASKEELSNMEKLLDEISAYMSFLYPHVKVNKDQQLVCFSTVHKKCNNDKSLEGVEEWTEYVPIYFILDYIEPTQDEIIRLTNRKLTLSRKILSDDEATYSLHMDIQSSDLYLRREVNVVDRVQKNEILFWSKMKNLEDQLKSYIDIKNGFVIFVSNNDTYNAVHCVSKIKKINSDVITLLPTQNILNVGKLGACQLIWKETREKEINCCIGTFDSYFDAQDYPCKIVLKKNTGSYNQIFESLGEDIVRSIHISSKVKNNYIEKFKVMLKPERILPSKKKTFGTWESPFLNDYSRLMMSPAVRRMKDKTQVFTMDDSDFVRTRLTHSLEVANIVRLLGLGIEEKLEKEHGEFKDIKKYYIPNILEVAALVHDIGNPPYGHFGEKTIQNYFRHPEKMPLRVRELFNQLNPQQKEDLACFDGNVQGFRILCHLGLSSDCTSFNLNKVILATMLKYPFNSLDGNRGKKAIDHRKSKFGFFEKEEHLYNKICGSLMLEYGQRHPLTYLLEAADDITYIGDDIEDGWKLNYITAKDIVSACEKLDEELRKKIFEEKWERLKDRIMSQNTIVVANAIQTMRIKLQRYMILRVIDVFCNNLEQIVMNTLDESKQELFNLDATLEHIHDIYWQPLVQKCYDGIHITQLQGERVITSLLNTYLEAIADPTIIKREEVNGNIELKLDNMSKSGMLFETISDNYRDDSAPIGQYIPQDAYGKLMLIVDYIAGMTDTFAYNRYNELYLN